MIINSYPSSNANTVSPFVSPGRQPVSQENSDLKTSSLKALEQLAALSRNENRRIPIDLSKTPTDRRKKHASNSDTQTDEKEQLAKDQIKIDALSSRDWEVSAYVQAHAAIGREYAGTSTYKFVKGLHGVNYAAASKVPISTSFISKLARQEEADAAHSNNQQFGGVENVTKNTINLNRHLAEIGTIIGSQTLGKFLNHRA